MSQEIYPLINSPPESDSDKRVQNLLLKAPKSNFHIEQVTAHLNLIVLSSLLFVLLLPPFPTKKELDHPE